MEISQGFEIKANLEVIKRRSSPEIDFLTRLRQREVETGKELLTTEDRLKLDIAIVQHQKIRNMTMTRAIDRFMSLFGILPGYGLDSATDDRMKIRNMLGGTNYRGGGPFRSSQEASGLWGEVVGIGSSSQAPSPTDAGLIADFNVPPVGPGYDTSGVTYRNTYNNKYGGIQPALGLTYDYDNDYVARYVATYLSSEINNLNAPIREIGLFCPLIQLAYHQVLPADSMIHFNDANCGNIFWKILNLSMLYSYVGQLRVATEERISLSGNRDTQLITPNNSEPAADNNNAVIVAFVPQWNSIPSGVGQWGSSNMFGVGEMLARAVLSPSFTKNALESLTVIWEVYTERYP